MSISISSSAGLAGFEFGSAYAASKFGWKASWSRSRPKSRRSASTRPSSIQGSSVPNLTAQSTSFADTIIHDYDERRAKQLEFWKSQHGRQAGDPAKVARALVTIANLKSPPLRFIAGADSIESTEKKVSALQQQLAAFRDLSTSLAFDYAATCDSGS
jgi:hypothetical protein